MATKIQIRRDSASNWTSNNPTLSAGEFGFETDTGKFKIGTGSSAWTSLSYSSVLPSDLSELSQDAVNSALTAGTGITKSYNDSANTITISVDSSTIASKSYVDTSISNLIDLAPGTLDTLNEIAAAINDDPAFFTTIATNLSNHESDTTNIHGIADTSILATTTGTQTLTNKTLTTPTINGPTITATGQTPTIHGIYLPATHNIIFEGETANDFETTLYVVDPTADRIVSLPDATTTLVGKDTVDTLTNKTLTSPVINTPTGITKSDVGLANIDNTSDANKPVSTATQTALDLKANTSAIAELAQDAVNTAIVAGVGLDKVYDDDNNTVTLDIDSTVATKTYADTAVSTHSSDTTDVHGIADTAELATKAFAASLLTGATKSNITITGDKTGLTITAENGVADSTTDNLTEGSTNKYFTDERAQDAVGNAVGTGLSYNDTTGAISVTTNTYDAYGSASTVAGNLSTHESDTTTHGTTGNIVGTSDTQTLTNKTLTSPKINEDVVLTATATELNYVDGVTSAIQTQIDNKASLSGATFTGAVSGTSLTLSGDLTVNGTTTTLNSTTLSVDDKNIELGSVATPSDATADGGGITLKGTTDKTFNWVDATDSWTSSEHINLASGKSLYLDGTLLKNVSETLTNKTLTSPIVSGLTISDGSIIIEGSTENSHETTLVFTDPTADRTITFPNATGTVAFKSDPPVVPTGATEPASAEVGQLFFDTDVNALKIYYGGIWLVLGVAQPIDGGTPGTTVFDQTYDGGGPETESSNIVDGGTP